MAFIDNFDIPGEYVDDIEDQMVSTVDKYSVSDSPSQLLESLNQYTREQYTSGSKHSRPIIMKLYADGLGLNEEYGWEEQVGVAASNQIIQDASLILDDMEDRDFVRRNDLAMWVKAVRELQDEETARDALEPYVVKLTHAPYGEISRLDIPREHKDALTENMVYTVNALGEGQAEDVVSEEISSNPRARELLNYDRDPEEFYSNMVDLKTSSFISGAAKAGAIMADYPIEHPDNWGKLFGEIYQISDDIADNLPHQDKDRFSDLGRSQASVVWIRGTENDETGLVEEVWSKDDPLIEEMEEAWDKVKRNGTIEGLQEDLIQLKHEADQELGEMEWENEGSKEQLSKATDFMLKRAGID